MSPMRIKIGRRKRKFVMNDVKKHVAYAKDVEDLARIVMVERSIEPKDALI